MKHSTRLLGVQMRFYHQRQQEIGISNWTWHFGLVFTEEGAELGVVNSMLCVAIWRVIFEYMCSGIMYFVEMLCLPSHKVVINDSTTFRLLFAESGHQKR